MSSKKKLLKLKEKLAKLQVKITSESIFNQTINKTKVENKEENEKKIMPVSLNGKVDKFIEWYSQNMVDGYYTDIGEYHEPIRMRDFIEKVAVWYELRYPDYEVNRKMHCGGSDAEKINNILFDENEYLSIMDNREEIRELDWDDFYNTHVFIRALPAEEQFYFQKPYYPTVVYWSHKIKDGSLKLSKNGTILEAYDLTNKDSSFTRENLVGKNIKDFLKMVKEKKIEMPKDSEMKKAVQYYDKWVRQKDKMLNSIMYRIIERGGNRIGPKRAFLFAKEFDRSIDVPMMYGVDTTDPGLREFVNEYLRAGGSLGLACYRNYFFRASDNEKVKIVRISEIVRYCWANTYEKYTKEEHDLHQSLVNSLANKLEKDKCIDTKKLTKKKEKNKKKKETN